MQLKMEDEEKELHVGFMREALNMVTNSVTIDTTYILIASTGSASSRHRRDTSRLRSRS